MKNENKKKRTASMDPEKRNGHLKDVFYHTRPESAQDCTGYTPVMPLCAEESEAYEDLMDLPSPEGYLRRDGSRF